ncbi:MAG: hypothetical protein HYV17_09890 [Xanthomonadales bacterium]|nr:hypothetical protein [Xanthomonadales bacterium]
MRKFLRAVGIGMLVACSGTSEPLPRALEEIIAVGADRLPAFPAEHADAVVNEKHVVAWASGEWLVLALRAGDVPHAERRADAALASLLASGAQFPAQVCREALHQAVASDRLGAAVLLLGETRDCLGRDALESARTLAVERGDASMQSLLNAALRGAGAGVAVQPLQ